MTLFWPLGIPLIFIQSKWPFSDLIDSRPARRNRQSARPWQENCVGRGQLRLSECSGRYRKAFPVPNLMYSEPLGDHCPLEGHGTLLHSVLVTVIISNAIFKRVCLFWSRWASYPAYFPRTTTFSTFLLQCIESKWKYTIKWCDNLEHRLEIRCRNVKTRNSDAIKRVFLSVSRGYLSGPFPDSRRRPWQENCVGRGQLCLSECSERYRKVSSAKLNVQWTIGDHCPLEGHGPLLQRVSATVRNSDAINKRVFLLQSCCAFIPAHFPWPTMFSTFLQ